jgi:Asp-tRNA(Asn)/Glu-tRNA(Gln) amidotransferase A subunit family amidase
MQTASVNELCFTPAETLAGMIRSKQLSPVELMEACLARIDAVNPQINAFIQLDAERGMREAREQADRIARGEELGPLCGLPFGVKELENAEGFRTTQGSRLRRRLGQAGRRARRAAARGRRDLHRQDQLRGVRKLTTQTR